MVAGMKLDEYLETTRLSYRYFAQMAGVGTMTVWRAVHGHGIEPTVAAAISRATREAPTENGGWVREAEIRVASRHRMTGSHAARRCRLDMRAPLTLVAEATGVTPSMLSRLERGERRWRLDCAVRWRRFMLEQSAHVAAASGRVVPVPDLDALLMTRRRSAA